MALGSYGSAAKSVAPKLFSVYTNAVLSPDLKFAHDISVQLMKAMRNIDRNVAARAENYMVKKGPLGVADFGWTITELPDGKKLIAGGFFHAEIPNKTNNILSRSQLFDPITGARTETGQMNVARCEHKATLFGNGKVLVAGGKNIGGDGKLRELSSQELYDSTTGTWTLITNQQPRL